MQVKSIVVSSLVAAAQVAAAPCEPKPKPYTPIEHIELGPRPFWLIDTMADSPVKAKLQQCANIKEFKPTAWSIGHRGGGTMMIPEHSLESNLAGARMGAAMLECDVAFTKDLELVCRHAQCDLHYTTDILTKPELAAKCTQPFKPAANGQPASAKCCTSDLTVAEFKTLCARMEGTNPLATTPAEYQQAPRWRPELYGRCGTVLTHKEHIKLVDDLGLLFVPELKTPEVPMPFGNYTQEDYAQQLADEYREAGIDPERVWLQSFLYDDVLYWVKKDPAFGKQAVFLDSYGETPATFPAAVANLTNYKADGVNIVAPPMQYLVKPEGGKIVPSEYALRAKELGLDIVAWSLERSGIISDGSGGGYYYGTIKDLIKRDGDVFELLYVLGEEIGILGMFSDWSATVTYYANCFGHIF
ncbi:glycerophosphoryl diester phosphodiesterase [Plectosphaerella plurivora]|uniref:glycerophosphodiester phosphodiesterase n=1 Tax=Plectosphaerella plurivora TaxID=936078 RepID=A0A9P9A7B7_9PEZI|nr:glycerophosphoryl diester phosphodiesterase [Plectosphaerella plurivora]